ncbi:type II secretion system F family protein, partial [Candidatus Woesearchaeota archaeon]|nr:type II secretion system F family protein [Candidatus Woesearchaeota archaeon]
MYKIFTKIIPKRFREEYVDLLKYSNIKIDAETLLGFLIFFGFGLGLGLAFFPAFVYKINYFLSAFTIFIALEILIFTWLNLKADKKSRFVENILPDFLQLMSSNLRAGMTTDRALLLSAREEFGPFQEEINRLGKEISTGKEIDKALIDLSHRIKSDKLEKTVLLLVNGIRSGGELADLLDQTASNLMSQKVVEEKVRSNVLLYVIFIFVAICFGAPLLFGLSTYLVEVFAKNLASVELPADVSAAQLPFAITKISISISFIKNYAI